MDEMDLWWACCEQLLGSPVSCVSPLSWGFPTARARRRGASSARNRTAGAGLACRPSPASSHKARTVVGGYHLRQRWGGGGPAELPGELPGDLLGNNPGCPASFNGHRARPHTNTI
ncbi:hypothetical protein CPLU01_11180 [Colletotrichum plurivorum]|uniref:Uncharacterized protein n=1 Tax=Colletotrichum plurivorum TaxID=2175906 RepID=A0A8H6K413_9PEZI|nr:hypothetical protein CPLU01_11180 [Colletotrichum plurivorum]